MIETSIAARCIRCKSSNVKPYGVCRCFCIDCGFTFHLESVDEQDELVRRLVEYKGGSPVWLS